MREQIHRDSFGSASTAANQGIGVGKRTLTEQLTAAPVQRKVGGLSAAHLVSDPWAIQAKAAPGALTDDRGSQAVASDGPGQAMPADVQRKMETSFGASFADVHIHEGPGAQALGARLHARHRHLLRARRVRPGPGFASRWPTRSWRASCSAA